MPISRTLMTRPAWVVRASLRSQRLKPYERFADMIDRHWDGIAADCRPENRFSLDFVEGLNNNTASSSDAPMACAIRSTSASRSLLACSTRYDPPKTTHTNPGRAFKLRTRKRPWRTLSRRAWLLSREVRRWIYKIRVD